MEDFHILSEKIIIREMQDADIEAIYSYRSLPEIARYQYWKPFTKEQTVDFVSKCKHPQLDKQDEWIGLAIEKEGNLIGDCAFKINDGTAEIGCNISPEYQNQGLAKEALCTLINYCFKNRDVNQIIGITDSNNSASIKLMESLGMKKNPDFENRVICKGEESIEYKYSMKGK